MARDLSKPVSAICRSCAAFIPEGELCRPLCERNDLGWFDACGALRALASAATRDCRVPGRDAEEIGHELLTHVYEAVRKGRGPSGGSEGIPPRALGWASKTLRNGLVDILRSRKAASGVPARQRCGDCRHFDSGTKTCGLQAYRDRATGNWVSNPLWATAVDSASKAACSRKLGLWLFEPKRTAESVGTADLERLPALDRGGSHAANPESVIDVVRRLDPIESLALSLFYMHGCSEEETGRQLELTPEVLRMVLSQAREKLKGTTEAIDEAL